MSLNKLKIIGLALLLIVSGLTQTVLAVQTTPDTINYQGRLLDNANTTLNGSYTFRFSIWSDADWDAGDVDGAGAIEVTAAGYESWQETHAVTTGPFGLFDIAIGSVTAFPSFNKDVHKYIQVEVKPTASPDTDYEVLDPVGDLTDVTDRKPLHNQAYANNADTIDNKEIGTSAGDIAIIDSGDQWNIDLIPGGTNEDTFVIDNDDTAAGDITLKFGDTLAKELTYSQANTWFNFNDDVNIEGDLTLTGTVNGVDVTNIDYMYIATRNKYWLIEPEYEGGVVELDGTTNRGTLEVEFEDTGGTGQRNHYFWRTRMPSMQDIDLVIRTELPLDFDSWQVAPISLEYKTDTGLIADNRVDVSIQDSTGTSVTLTGGSALASATWADADMTFGGVPTWTAGTPITIRIKLSARSGSKQAYIGNISLNYVGK